MQLVRLQQTFGVAPHEALFVRPAWEIDLLVRALPPLQGEEVSEDAQG